ncbi:MAG TPA: Mrp/NBP35 family ATP-binding protein [Nocardioidaceae bacterium]|nr:Mrp/NBP35 family ATP-binding protein [Nocardioidaceae bacterium]
MASLRGIMPVPPRTRARADLSALREQVSEAVGVVPDPLTGRSLADIGMVGDVECEGDMLRVSVWRPAVDSPGDVGLKQRVETAVRSVEGVREVGVRLKPMDDARRTDLALRLRQSRHRPGGLGDRTAIYAVGSGKGGVGKSTLTANLAVSLARTGRRVGVLDADVWGYSMPQLLGVREPPVAVKGIMLPVPAHGIALMSVGFFVGDDEPVVWRGPMLHKAIEQFLDDVYWGDLDVLLVDLPPGTGDVTLSIAELLPDAAMLVATTPQAAAEQVAARVGRMARDARMPVAGVVENMSGTVCAHCGETTAAFGSGGGRRLAATLDTELLGEVPLDPALCEAGDAGTPLVLAHPASASARALARVAEALPVVRRSVVGRSLPLFVS